MYILFIMTWIARLFWKSMNLWTYIWFSNSWFLFRSVSHYIYLTFNYISRQSLAIFHIYLLSILLFVSISYTAHIRIHTYRHINVSCVWVCVCTLQQNRINYWRRARSAYGARSCMSTLIPCNLQCISMTQNASSTYFTLE